LVLLSSGNIFGAFLSLESVQDRERQTDKGYIIVAAASQLIVTRKAQLMQSGTCNSSACLKAQ